MKYLEQNFKRDKRSFQITEKGVLVKLNSKNEIQQYEVPFEEIGTQTLIYRNSPDTAVILLLFSSLFNIIFLLALLDDSFGLTITGGKIVLFIFIVIFTVLVAIFGKSLKSENIKKLDGIKPLLFFYDHKSEKEVDGFIAEILNSKRDFFIKEYYKIDNLLPIEVQKNRIHWLYESKYINEDDAKFILEELDRKRIIEGL
ncbi:hypothetical protein [Chryseobacterium taklimakanense]|uniref:Uncharacterized protein n=1 Tax=Chryseobacterium taklimakanense TaxID=536441 RepID=A0A239WJ54_9FLAO|nr:hypothetical protein [Chryseobacterium taklimakanense]SNV34156.1 Uncharacterised protein [Chryseobacterium taklimakanense]